MQAPAPAPADAGGDDMLGESRKYEKIQVLGRGTFGCVYLARNVETQELVAIKMLPRGEVNKYVEAEIVNHSLLRHPHVIQFKEVFLTSRHICISMVRACVEGRRAARAPPPSRRRAYVRARRRCAHFLLPPLRLPW